MTSDLPPPTLTRVLFGPPDWAASAVCAALALGYAVCLMRLWRRGDRWPRLRTVAWYGGIVVLFLATGTGFSRYAMVLFSAHMGQHMILNMYAPVLMALGAPATLLLRALPAHRDRRGARAIILRVLHSRVVGLVSSLPMALLFFVVSLFGLYFTPAFSVLMSTMLGHRLMEVHFLLTGYLFFWTIVGPDPGPRRPPVPVRIAVLAPVNAAHAFFAVIVLFSGVILGEPYLSEVHPLWISLHHDQDIGGAIAAGSAEVPIAGTAVPLFLRWMNGLQRRDARRPGLPALPADLRSGPDRP